jgi:hypothetical protein
LVDHPVQSPSVDLFAVDDLQACKREKGSLSWNKCRLFNIFYNINASFAAKV